MIWEYSIVSVKDEDAPKLLTMLNEAGKAGWEFTGHVTDTGRGSDYLMKRLTHG